MEHTAEQLLSKLFEKYKSHPPQSIQMLPPSGSYRKYFRIKFDNHTYIGVYNEDLKENIAFINFTKHFITKSLNVPDILAEDLDKNIYLIQDLGDTTLLKELENISFQKEFTSEVINIYKKVLVYLPQIQIKGAEGFDYSVCYPRQAFDKQSMLWDLNYFKYYFLKLAKVPFYEQELEDDFQTFTNFLLTADCNYFLFRDFQSRNIMLFEEKPYFIDYQSGRKGALHYDIASILFESKTAIPPDVREELLDFYIHELQKLHNISKEQFMHHYYGYVYIRLMQAMGAYGFRGLYEKKELFLQSIPPALKHLEWLLENVELPIKIPELTKVWNSLIHSENIRNITLKTKRLEVQVNSFSYRRGIPVDHSANGGGFVFDCRAIHNPGRYEQYKTLTGRDAEVIEFFSKYPETEEFVKETTSIVSKSIMAYLQKGYTNLMVNYGCTGGQHRSVYCAERLAENLKIHFPDIDIKLQHKEFKQS